VFLSLLYTYALIIEPEYLINSNWDMKQYQTQINDDSLFFYDAVENIILRY